jgi:hypothetical protein
MKLVAQKGFWVYPRSKNPRILHLIARLYLSSQAGNLNAPFRRIAKLAATMVHRISRHSLEQESSRFQVQILHFLAVECLRS